jgi:segregation and condensation protein B
VTQQSHDERPPISWELLAAELDGELTDDGQDPAAALPDADWDAVAARLAAELGDPAGDPAPVEDVETPPATPGPFPGADPDAGRVPLGRAPQQAPVEFVVVDQPEPAVEETVAAAPDGQGGDTDVADDPGSLRGGLEALLFVVDAPADEITLAAALRCPVARVRDELAGLAADYERRGAGVTLRRVGEGWRVYTREEHAEVVERYLLEGQRSRLTQAALETLAVIAYRQPVTRARVSAIRGVGVDAVVRTLVSRGLVSECGTDPDTGGHLYATTPLFLERLGLASLDELPELAPLLPETSSMLAEHPDA